VTFKHTGRPTDADDDAGGAADQRGDVGHIAGGAAKFMAEKLCAMRDLLRRRLGRHRGALGLRIESS
jgi:hypothetical protein